ncbi:Vacuolar protein sorting-associated protein 72 [Mycena sanguinolenta]|uniref:Vacuolar protein sorting-associated protein 72 n=1 Tax=Mycena sanguinolenta TaxID=230812 RepID=A0A8H6ZG85_9AGAR|nr:Vacuolar protein sorting-associated protein 72 [Mycena sanguinolenta]
MFVIILFMDVNAPEELLATRRSPPEHRRMEAAMAEMELDGSLKDAEEDADYTNDKDEEDIFDDDFESTDEEAADEAAGELAAQEDRRARKARAIRTRLEKATDAAHARNKATFNPQATEAPRPKPRRRVALGGAVNAATGETISGPGGEQRRTAHRQSMRKHTILNTSLTETRLKRSEEKKASQAPKKARAEVPTISQAELIARALDAEEGNIIQHRDYLKLEEEKRRRARVVRPTVQGPLVRWVSRVEEAKIVIPPPPPPTYNYGYTAGGNGGYVFPAYQPVPGPSSNPMNNTVSSSPANVPPVASSSITPYRPQSRHSIYPVHPSGACDAHRESRAELHYSRGNAKSRDSNRWAHQSQSKFRQHETYLGRNNDSFIWLARKLGRREGVFRQRAAYIATHTNVCPLRTWAHTRPSHEFLNHEFVWNPEFGAYVRQEQPPSVKPIAMTVEE